MLPLRNQPITGSPTNIFLSILVSFSAYPSHQLHDNIFFFLSEHTHKLSPGAAKNFSFLILLNRFLEFPSTGTQWPKYVRIYGGGFAYRAASCGTSRARLRTPKGINFVRFLLQPIYRLASALRAIFIYLSMVKLSR